MQIKKTSLPGLIELHPNIHGDNRGYFFESYNQKVFEQAGIHARFVQDNQSLSKKGVLRGLHFQREPYTQAKMVRVLKGKVLDVAVDIRKGSPTYGQNYSCLLSEENKVQLLIPRGFAHGFIVLSDEAEFFYKCDNFYSKQHEAGIIFNDPDLKIDWQLAVENLIVSAKDQQLPFFRDLPDYFSFEKMQNASQ